MKKQLLYSILLLCFFCCSGITYKTIYQGQTDPTFVFPSGTTIGLVPMFRTKVGRKQQTDESFEKFLLSHFKKELESRGANVFYVPVENLKEEEEGNPTLINLEEYPYLVLTVVYAQRIGEVDIPARISSFLGGGPNYSYVYPAKIFELRIGSKLWSGSPDYKKIVWRGEVLKGSPTPNLLEQAPSMIHDLFLKKFLKN